jgi:hypothetical protein
MNRARTSGILFGLALASCSLAQNGVIDLSVFPSISISDGKSPVTVTAVLRDSSGALVPNGTQVLFETNWGSFRENVVTTENGYARATLIAPDSPGIARIRASSLRFSANHAIEMEFVADRSLLNSAKEFIEVTAPKTLFYSIPEKTIEASGPGQAVQVRYRDIEIAADDIQLNVPTYELKARNAKVTYGSQSYLVQELSMKLNLRRGVGVAEYETDSVRFLQSGPWVSAYKTKRRRLGPVEISSLGLTPIQAPLGSHTFKFRDLTGSLSSVEAKKAVAYPRRDIYFYRSNVRVSGVSVMKVPLFQVNANTSNPLITDQFLNMTGTRLNVNYPHYLSLKPGETSLVRLRYGSRFGSGVGAAAGLYVDYEMKWNRGDEMEGGLTFYGLNRSDWGAGIRQSLQPDPYTTINAQVDFPAHRSLFGSLGVNRTFDGFQANLSANHGRSLGGVTPFESQQYNLLIERDPIGLGAVPAQLFLGVSAMSSRFSGGVTRSQSGVGWQARVASRSLRVDPSNSLTASFRVSQLAGSQFGGLQQTGSIALSSQFGKGLGLFTTYDYVQDGFSSDFLGRHRVSTEAVATMKNLTLRGFLSKSMDINRFSGNINSRWAISGLWRAYANFSFDRYLDGSFSDRNYIISYRLGFREVGLSYNERTKRFGIEVLGASY